MNIQIRENLQKQIETLKNQIKLCEDKEFDTLIHKYNIFNNIKNTILEENFEIEKYNNRLENDNKILEKIYNRFLNINIKFSLPSFDEVILETFLEKEQEREEKLINLFRNEYVQYPNDNGMIPANSTILQNYSLQEINLLIDKGILQKRDCVGLAFEFTNQYINKIKKELSEELNYEKCKNILSIDFSKVNNLEKLQNYKVNLIDSYRYINNYKEFNLTTESVRKGFIVQVPDISIDSFVPKDKFMSDNIRNALDKIYNKSKEIIAEEVKEKNINFSSGDYKGIFYSVMEDCDENKGGYFIEFYKVIDINMYDIDFDNRLDFMVIHADNYYEMLHPEEVIKEYIDSLIEGLENENSEEI